MALGEVGLHHRSHHMAGNQCTLCHLRTRVRQLGKDLWSPRRGHCADHVVLSFECDHRARGADQLGDGAADTIGPTAKESRSGRVVKRRLIALGCGVALALQSNAFTEAGEPTFEPAFSRQPVTSNPQRISPPSQAHQLRAWFNGRANRQLRETSTWAEHFLTLNTPP